MKVLSCPSSLYFAMFGCTMLAAVVVLVLMLVWSFYVACGQDLGKIGNDDSNATLTCLYNLRC